MTPENTHTRYGRSRTAKIQDGRLEHLLSNLQQRQEQRNWLRKEKRLSQPHVPESQTCQTIDINFQHYQSQIQSNDVPHHGQYENKHWSRWLWCYYGVAMLVAVWMAVQELRTCCGGSCDGGSNDLNNVCCKHLLALHLFSGLTGAMFQDSAPYPLPPITLYDSD